MKLRNQLSISYIALVIVCVLSIGLLANNFLDNQFKSYVKDKQVQKNKDTLSLISNQYHEGKWDVRVLEGIGVNALEAGLIVKVTSLDGATIWDATTYNKGMCKSMITHMTENMYSRYPDWKGEYITNSYDILNGSIKVGKLDISYYGPVYFTDSDLVFINTLNRLFLYAGLIALIFAIILGTLISRKLAKPILKVADTSDKIAHGKYEVVLDAHSNIEEISVLENSINKLASTLGRQEILRKNLTADVAHELRTPLATLQSHMEAMIDGIWAADKERLTSCHEEILRLGRLIGSLETLAKYEADSMTLKYETFDINDLLKSILMNCQADFNAKNLTVSYSENSIIIDADRDKISQVLINIISNATKYSNQDGKINITTEVEKDMLKIRIADNGIGISAEDLPYIFERFYRADKSRNRLTGGAGIGLAIAKAIVTSHKGEIYAESGLDGGSTFIVSLPLI